MAADADIKDPRISKSASALPANAIESVPYVDFRTLGAVMQAVSEVFYGTITGTGADLDTNLPFDPVEVRIFNETQLEKHESLPSLAAGESIQTITDGTISLNGADGITLGAKGERKFTTGSAVHANSDVLHFVAIGSRGVGGSL